MHKLLLLLAAAPLSLSAQKTTTIQYQGPATVDLYKNGQVVTYQHKGVTHSDTVYSGKGTLQLSVFNATITRDHGRQLLPTR